MGKRDGEKVTPLFCFKVMPLVLPPNVQVKCWEGVVVYILYPSFSATEEATGVARIYVAGVDYIVTSNCDDLNRKKS